MRLTDAAGRPFDAESAEAILAMFDSLPCPYAVGTAGFARRWMVVDRAELVRRARAALAATDRWEPLPASHVLDEIAQTLGPLGRARLLEVLAEGGDFIRAIAWAVDKAPAATAAVAALGFTVVSLSGDRFLCRADFGTGPVKRLSDLRRRY